jgi:fission process protein 1
MAEADEKTKKEVVIDPTDVKILMSLYDKDDSGSLSSDEISKIIEDYNDYKARKFEPYSSKLSMVKKIIDKYHLKGDELLTTEDSTKLHGSFNEAVLPRFAAYTSAFARASRYLAFTSDLGEALRPVIAARLVTGTYMISVGYCMADVGYEAYKLKERGYVHETTKEPVSMAQCVVERATFQAVASIGIPFVLIHSAVSVSHKFFKKIGRFNRWGPSITGLAIIPLLPMYFDEPIEHALEHGFSKFGPWARTGSKSHDH